LHGFHDVGQLPFPSAFLSIFCAVFLCPQSAGLGVPCQGTVQDHPGPPPCTSCFFFLSSIFPKDSASRQFTSCCLPAIHCGTEEQLRIQYSTNAGTVQLTSNAKLLAGAGFASRSSGRRRRTHCQYPSPVRSTQGLVGSYHLQFGRKRTAASTRESTFLFSFHSWLFALHPLFFVLPSYLSTWSQPGRPGSGCSHRLHGCEARRRGPGRRPRVTIPRGIDIDVTLAYRL
jgi:hypothetical protein